MIILDRVQPFAPFSQGDRPGTPDLPLTAEQRQKSRQRIELPTGEIYLLKLPRGSKLQVGDTLTGENPELAVRVTAQLEEVITVRAKDPLELLKGAYHLGNRHIPLEITPHYLRLNRDRVLEEMLMQLGLTIAIETVPFFPEMGAYHHHDH